MLSAVICLAFGLGVYAQGNSHGRGRKYKPPPPTSRVEVTILRKDDGKPIENAAVIWHLVGDKGNMELKTDEDGKSVIDVLPTGSEVLLQIIAKGYQTFGGDYKLDKPTMSIEVKLKRPVGEYSIYADKDIRTGPPNGTGNQATGTPEASTAKDASKDSAQKGANKDSSQKDASKDKSSDSAKQDNTQPAANQQPQ